jgi:hypothetical protein
LAESYLKLKKVAKTWNDSRVFRNHYVWVEIKLTQNRQMIKGTVCWTFCVKSCSEKLSWLGAKKFFFPSDTVVNFDSFLGVQQK